MKDKEDFLHRLEESLDVMDKNLDDMFAQTQERELEKDALEELREQHARARKHAEKLRAAAGEDAERVQQEAHTVWEDLKQAFAQVRSRLGD